MVFVQNDHLIQAFSPNRADNPFGIRVLPRRTIRCNDFLNSHVLDPPAKDLTIDGIPVAQDVPGHLIVWKGFDDLLASPLRRRFCGDVYVKQPAVAMAENHHTEQNLERDGRHGEEVDGHNLRCMIF